MGSSPLTPRKSWRRAWLMAVGAGCVVILAVIAVATRGFGIAESGDRPSKELTAQNRCESDVLKQLASPSMAKLSNVEVASTDLDPDSQDLFSLLDDPLKGVDHSRITVLNVSGVVDVEGNAFGDTIHDTFSCRAYFIDGDLANTLVLFDHDH
ncbi:MAG: hypothetical protein K2X52_19585 [Mycobacteriaceae bacterium]|nr:hypothetical protein [Mycobacteriaceae bacterium]